MSQRRTNQKGFTLVELMIATAVFSSILLLCTFGLLQVGRTYYKGAAIARTQNVTRSVLENITQAIQYGSSAPRPVTGVSPNEVVVPLGTSGVFCVGANRYTYTTSKVSGTSHALVQDAAPSAGCSSGPTVDGKELLGENMRLTKFQILKSGNDYQVLIKVTYGDDDLIELSDPLDTDPAKPPYGNCKVTKGSQFCAASQLESTVHRRVSSS